MKRIVVCAFALVLTVPALSLSQERGKDLTNQPQPCNARRRPTHLPSGREKLTDPIEAVVPSVILVRRRQTRAEIIRRAVQAVQGQSCY